MNTEIAYAKINLALHVRERRADGYHDLETIFAFCEDGDLLEAGGGGLALTIKGDHASGLDGETDNLVVRAANLLNVDAALTLTKNLPVAAGLGGGSADAAAALRLLNRLRRLDLDANRLLELAGSLGADVPACVASRTARGEGVGDRLEFIDASRLTGMPVLLVNPGIALATGKVFAAWDGHDRGALLHGDPLTAAIEGRNDLETPARSLVPEIGELLDWLQARQGVVLARMSGSGATCFGLFENREACTTATAQARSNYPGYWTMQSRLR